MNSSRSSRPVATPSSFLGGAATTWEAAPDERFRVRRPSRSRVLKSAPTAWLVRRRRCSPVRFWHRLSLPPPSLRNDHDRTPAVPTLDWVDCGDGLQCTNALVPLDYDRPDGSQISLALARVPAGDPAHRVGSIFVNNGGPGNSVLDFVRGDARNVLPADVQASFDIVGFDPRGVGRSTPVRCFADAASQEAFFGSLPPFPVTQDEVRTSGRRIEGTRQALPSTQRRPTRSPLDCQRRPRHGPPPSGRGRQATHLRRLLLRRAVGDDLRSAVPGKGPRTVDRRWTGPGRVVDRSRR